VVDAARDEAGSLGSVGSGDQPVRRHWRRWKRILVRTFFAIIDMDTSLRCAGVAFFGFLSLFPAIAIIVLLVGLLADRAALAGIIENASYVLPNIALEIIREQLSTLIRQPPANLGIGLVLSVALALWSGSRGVNALVFAMSRVRREPERRSFLMTVVISVGLTLGGSLVLLISLSVVAVIPAVTQAFYVPKDVEQFLLLGRWPVLLVISTIVTAMLYRYGPDRHPKNPRFIWPGAVLASVLWIAAGSIFSIYVENFSNYEASFGSVTAAVVLLLWMYNSAQIFVLGAAFNTQYEYARQDEKGGPVVADRPV